MDENETREALLTIHDAMMDEGLFSGVNEQYWYSIWDALVARLCPSIAEE